MNGDARGWRIALLPDILVNPPPALRAGLPDVLASLAAQGYGVLQLPPAGAHAELLAVIADQVEEYAHHGYAVAAIGLRRGKSTETSGDGLHWRSLSALLRRRGVALPARHFLRPEGNAVREGQALAEFLSGHDLPEAERRRWRS
jgi:hypothetical protein